MTNNKNKKKHELPFIRSMAPADVPGDQERFNKSVDFSSTSGSSASSSGESACCAESLNEEDLPDVKAEPLTQSEIEPELPVDTDQGIASMLTQAICDQWQSLDNYTSMAQTCEDLGYEEIAEVLKSVVSEQTTHIGKLQKSLESVSPTIQLIDQGEANAELTLHEDLEIIDDEQVNELEKALGVILSSAQQNYIYDKWRAFYNDPDKYPELVDVIKDQMTKDGVFVESVFNRKLDEGMKILKIDTTKENLIDQESNLIDGTENDITVEATKKHLDNAKEVIKERSKALDKDGGILGAKKQPVPDKVSYPKVKIEEKYMSTSDFDQMLKDDEERDNDDPEKVFPKTFKTDSKGNVKTDAKGDPVEDVADREARIKKFKRDNVDPDLDLTNIHEAWIYNISDKGMKYLGLDISKYEAIENEEDLTFEQKDLKFRRFNEEADDIIFNRFGIHAEIIKRNKKTNLWDIEVSSESKEELQAFLDQHNLSNAKIYTRKDIAKAGIAQVEKIVKDLRYMLQAELSNDAGDGYNELIFSQDTKSPSYISASERYKSELTGLPTRNGTSMDFELSITPDGYMVHVDKPERLDFAQKVAQAYKKFGLKVKEHEPQPWKRTPNERYKMEFIVPEWTDGIDIGSAAAKKRYAGMEDATPAMKEFAGIQDEEEKVVEEPTNIKNYKDKSIFKN